MRTLKPKTDSVERRSFIRQAGAVVTGTVASAVAMGAGIAPRAERAKGDSKELARLSHQLGLREDIDAIRQLHHAFGTALNERRYQDLVRLFADDARVHLNGGVLTGNEIRRLYVDQFGGHGEQSEPVHACLIDSAHESSIEVAPDRRSATARFPCLTQLEHALEGSSPLVEMARQQGQGVRQWWEHGLYENSYVKRGGAWQLLELRYRTIGRADVTKLPIPG
jgi:carotenoid cleavage dioxygenase